MSTQSVNSSSLSDDPEEKSESVPTAEIVVSGRNVEIPDHYRVYVGHKLVRLERLDRSLYRFDVELEHERNRRQRKNCQHVEITARGRGPVVRGEACADSFYGAFEAAVNKLENRLRRSKDRRTVHHGGKTPVSLHEATAVAPQDVAEAFRPGLAADDAGYGADSAAGFGDAAHDGQEHHEPGRIVRIKEHPAKPMTIDDALYEMELVGHDFFLFHDKESDRPSVVYRRHAYDYGLIRLA
jgi:ribosomal subunit interface protein